MSRLWAWALRLLQKQCIHDSRNVIADVLEGDHSPHFVAWCRVCGAYKRGYRPADPGREYLSWTMPRPDWWI